MLLSRRRILQSAIAAPFIISPRRASAFLLRGGAAIPTDLTAAALASLANSTWSSDQIASGNHINDLNFGGNLSIQDVLGFSGGCYLGGQKKFVLPGTGGHDGSPNTGIATLNLPTTSWSVTEPSATYHTDGVADPSNPCTNSETSFKSWPNVNGDRAPMAGHRYSAPIWMPEISYGFSYGEHSYNSGANGDRGYYLFNSSGQHDQTKGFSGNFIGGSATMTTAWIAGRKRLWGVTSGSTSTVEIDPLTGTSTLTNHCNIVNAGQPDMGDQPMFCLIPDPNNAGDLALVCWSYNFFVGSEKVVYIPKVGSGAIGQTSSAIAFGGSVPAALSVGNAAFTYHDSVFFDFAGNYKSGSTKILVWDWKGGSTAATSLTGLYLLDTSNWTWSGPLTGSPGPFASRWSTLTGQLGFSAGAAYGFRHVFVMTDYIATGSYLPIGLIQPDSTSTATAGQLYFYKIPWSAL